MEFQTNRLQIHPITPADKEYVLDLLTDETVSKTYMLPEYQRREDAEPLFLRLMELSGDDSRYVAGVYLDDRFIGMMNGVDIKEKQIEMGYAYLPPYYNHGYATEAFAGAIRYLLAQGFDTVLAGAFSENPASLRVMEKCGMIKQDYTDTVDYRGITHTCIYYAAGK